MKPLNHLAWVVSARGEVLHCVPDVIDDAGLWHDTFVDDGGLEAAAVCGLHKKYVAPGVFTRMGARRCVKCCTVLGMPSGDGTPLNEAAASEASLNKTSQAP